MKKLMTLLLSLALILNSFVPPLSMAAGGIPGGGDNTKNYTADDLKNLQSEPVLDNDSFEPAGPKWLAYVGNEQPATFAEDKISCTLAKGVVEINNISKNLADMGQVLSGSTVQKQDPGRIVEKGGYISRSVLDKAAGKVVKNGTVVVDKATGTAFKVSSPTEYSGVFNADPELKEMVKPLESTYSVTKPELHEVIQNFELKEDTVKLNKANITSFAPNVESSIRPFSAKPLSVGDEDKKFKYLTGDNLIQLDFKDATVLNGKVGNSTIYVELSGGIAIDAIQVTGRYSCNGGYEISMTLQQECYLVAMLDAEVHEEIRVPILGIDIPFGIGEVYGGIFAIIGMDGSVRLDIEARETSACKMGIKGGTFLYVPTSFHPIFEPTPPKITGDCNLLGQINGYIKFGPMVGLELFGFDLVGAGVLLGTGVNVESDETMLDIELYASIDVYLALAGKTFNLVRARPTIYKKQQPDMHGYRVSFLETYVEPGRVGGLIEQEPSQSGGAYILAEGLKYRVWIVPGGAIGTFEAAKRETILSADKSDAQKQARAKVRTYPENGFATINAEGEFFEEADHICYAGDQVWLEFIGKIKDSKGNWTEKTFFTGPATPILPFTDVTITYADLFNDYITGKVEPKRTILWKANRLNPDEIQTELTYYKGPVYISPFNDYGMSGNKHLSYTLSGTARTDTTEKGEFDTRNPYTDENGVRHPGGTIDVLEQSNAQNVYYENGEKKYSPVYPPKYIGVFASLQINGAVNNSTFYGITPSMPDFQITRTLDYVENSYKTLKEGEKLVSQMEYREYIWIANPSGTRAVTADMLKCYDTGFSTQDYKGYNENPVKTIQSGAVTLTQVPDPDGKTAGTTLFARQITLQWVWQAHPNPVKITSDDHTRTIAGTESTFQVKAKGFLPRYSLESAPQRVWIDEKTGLLHIPQTMAAGKYIFTIHAKEGIALSSVTGYDPKKGNDSSEPDSQVFTLTVDEKATESSQSEVSAPQNTPTTKPGEKTAPVIYSDEYNTYFNMDGSKDLSVSFKAAGSTPVTWSLVSADGGAMPAGFSIHAGSGVLTVTKSIAAGSYHFAVKATNEVGSGLHDCTLVMTLPTAPVFENRRDGYQFTMSRAKTDFTVQIKANGSQPIVYSLEAVNNRIPVPSEITIQASTGLLSVKGGLIGGINAGFYDFVIRAKNTAGSSTRTCRLEVTASTLPAVGTGNSTTGSNQPGAVFLAVSSTNGNTGGTLSQNQIPDLFGGKIPPNSLTIRCDDPRDVYTHDRDNCNGAAFIHWDTRIVITAAKVIHASYLTGSSLDGQNLESLEYVMEIKDNTPVCDRYHYYDPAAPTLPLSEEELAKLRADMKKAIHDEIESYKNGYQTIQNIDVTGADGAAFDFRVNPMEKVTSGLEYGSLVDEITAQKGGTYTVELGNETGTVISGAYFTALSGNPKASLTFQQEGVRITFSGKDITKADALDLINIGYTYAPHEKTMLDKIGTGGHSFAYGFQHHGALPGTADFVVTTTLSAGEKVNVYKFDAASGGFTLIAKGVTVGEKGVVTYKNNTMSEYVITTKTIPGAAISDRIGLFNPARSLIWWIVGIGLIVLVLAGTALLIFFKMKRSRIS